MKKNECHRINLSANESAAKRGVKVDGRANGARLMRALYLLTVLHVVFAIEWFWFWSWMKGAEVIAGGTVRALPVVVVATCAQVLMIAAWCVRRALQLANELRWNR